MTSFNKILISVFLAVAYASSALAVPSPPAPRHSTHHRRTVGEGLQLETFHPSSTYETFGGGIDHPLSRRDNPSIEESATAFVQSKLNVDASTIALKSSFAGQAAKHVYIKQSHNGIPFVNAVANVAFNNDNKVVAFGSSFVKPTQIASSTPTVPVDDAIKKASPCFLGNTTTPHINSISRKGRRLCSLDTCDPNSQRRRRTWYDAFVDAHSGELVHVTDFVAKASYRVLPITKEVLTQGFEVLTDPQDPLASPLGWHSTGTQTIRAWKQRYGVQRSRTSLTTQSSPNLNFLFTQDPTTTPTTAANVDAARTNAFYIVNTLHDITYRYGFTESAFNFQSNNFGKGGVGNDPVTISVQSRMYLWDYTSPERDGALENDIVTHENTHGLTNRLTGGGTGACLQTTEAGGLGEGWSDAMADWVEHTSSATPDTVMGPYVANFATGVRAYPYSTSSATNPLRYSSLNTYREVHAIGEIWANMLHNVYASLVAAHGWSATSHTNPSGTEGNIVFLHLFIDALSLQPCNPTFLNARDAWIQADANRYAGANKCLLWRAFASRGMGVNAASYGDSSAVPAGC
ncbi:Fungalysin metallopeptidase-domain-containing protein [Infundibulicybe gibba]|nr:Fungalysin metallopeptidase-domain-containing protein [Infundibulicybe gibba]